MKQCPKCGSTYSDDTLFYCLTDGNNLVPVPDGDDTPTVVHGRGSAPETQVIAPPTRTEHVALATGGVSPAFKYAAIGLGALVLLLAIGGFAAWSLMKSRQDQSANTSNSTNQSPAIAGRQVQTEPRNTSNENTTNGNISTTGTPERSPTPKPTATPERQETDDADSEDRPPDPGTGRIAFQKGSDSKVFRGMVSDKRSYVLRTMSGQRLSARVNSPDGCVSFEGGAGSVGFTTPSGDVSLTVFNKCDEPSSFTLSVTVR